MFSSANLCLVLPKVVPYLVNFALSDDYSKNCRNCKNETSRLSTRVLPKSTWPCGAQPQWISIQLAIPLSPLKALKCRTTTAFRSPPWALLSSRYSYTPPNDTLFATRFPSKCFWMMDAYDCVILTNVTRVSMLFIFTWHRLILTWTDHTSWRVGTKRKVPRPHSAPWPKVVREEVAPQISAPEPKWWLLPRPRARTLACRTKSNTFQPPQLSQLSGKRMPCTRPVQMKRMGRLATKRYALAYS